MPVEGAVSIHGMWSIDQRWDVVQEMTTGCEREEHCTEALRDMVFKQEEQRPATRFDTGGCTLIGGTHASRGIDCRFVSVYAVFLLCDGDKEREEPEATSSLACPLDFPEVLSKRRTYEVSTTCSVRAGRLRKTKQTWGQTCLVILLNAVVQ